MQTHGGNIKRASVGFGKRFPSFRLESASNVPERAGIGIRHVQARYDRVELAKGGGKRESFHGISVNGKRQSERLWTSMLGNRRTCCLA
jgi:hypothetical protein